MKFAILGAGGVGGYYGGLLAKMVMMCASSRERPTWLCCGNVAWRSDARGFIYRPRSGKRQRKRLQWRGLRIGGCGRTIRWRRLPPAAAFLAAQGALIVPLLNGVEVADN